MAVGDVREAFDRSVEAATHLTDLDAGAVAAARALADKIDAWDVIVDWAMEDAADSGGRPSVPANDNVSLPSFLKFCDALGLTPTGRKGLTLEPGGDPPGEKGTGLSAFEQRLRDRQSGAAGSRPSAG